MVGSAIATKAQDSQSALSAEKPLSDNQGKPNQMLLVLRNEINVKYTVANELLYQVDVAKKKYKITDKQANRILSGILGSNYPAEKTYGIGDGIAAQVHLLNSRVKKGEPKWKMSVAALKEKTAAWKDKGAVVLKKDEFAKAANGSNLVPLYVNRPDEFATKTAETAYNMYAAGMALPGYKIGQQDCYSFVTECTYAANKDIVGNEKEKNFIETLSNQGWDSECRIYEFGYSFVHAGTGKIPWSGLKVGDVLFAEKSPNLTGHNHWGIVAEDKESKKKGTLCVIHRSGKNVPLKNTVEWFYRAGGTMNVYRACGVQ
ncbi:Uncharacterised protein [Candidatus Gugararchaeum adminiculabundum]|nr:Uncharacterised protein [Candidatus Gugararchaeum adminiculabundum]